MGRQFNFSGADSFYESLCNSVDRSVSTKDSGEPFWRKEDPVLDKDGKVVKGGLFQHQREFWNLPNFIRVMVGGLGCGKTATGCKRIVSAALDNAPCPVAAVSPTFSVARRTVIPGIQELLQGKQARLGRAFWWRYNSATHEFKIRYHGRDCLIQILSGERPLSLRGPNLAVAYIDEPFIQDFEVFQQMMARIRHPDAVYRMMLITGSPEGNLGWGYDLCTGMMKGKPDVGIVHASTRANLALSPDYVQRLESVYSERAAQAYIEGKFVNLNEGLVYYAFDPMEHVVDLPMPTGAELGVGMDFNVNPMAACVFWRRGSQVHIFKTYELPNADTEYLCQVLKEQFWDKGLREVFPDASGKERSTKAPGGKSDFHYIREAGFTIRCKDANPKRKDRYNAVNGKLKPRNGKVSLTIGKDCQSLIRAASTYSHELMLKQESLSHILDAMSYPIAYLFPVDRESLRVQQLLGY